jgi:hypothetical protein
LTPDAALTAGARAITYTLTDTAGNESLASGALNLTVEIAATGPAVTNTSATYTSASDTLVLTGTGYTNLLASGETATTDIKARLDWAKLSWDINGDDGTNNVAFALTDIASANVSSDGTLTIVLTTAKARALEANAAYDLNGSSAADTIDITTGFAKDSAGVASSSDGIANAPLTLPSSASIVASATADFNALTSAFNIAAADYLALQGTLTETYVTTKEAAAITLGKAGDFYTAAQTMFNKATAQMVAATALGAAAADTADAADDGPAATIVAQANANMAAASTNMASATRMKDNMTIYRDSFYGTISTVSGTYSGQAVSPDLTTYSTRYINDGYQNITVTNADVAFTGLTGLDTVLLGHTTGVKTLTFGANFNTTGTANIYSSGEGGQTITATDVTIPISVTSTNPVGAVTFSGGTNNTNFTGLLRTSAATVTCQNGDNNIDMLSTSGALTATSGNGTNSINVETTANNATAGAIEVKTGNGSNQITAMTNGGAITIETKTGMGVDPAFIATETIKAFSQTGAVTINITTALVTASVGTVNDHINIETNTNASATTLQGVTVIHGSNGAHNIKSSTLNSSITIDTHNSDDIVSASTGGGAIIVNTGAGNDTIFVASGTGGAVIDGGAGTNTITLGAHSSVADTINATSAYATLVHGATIGSGLADIYKFAGITATAASTTAQTYVEGTTSATISAAGLLSFDTAATSTGTVFAEQVLTFMKATAATFGGVVSYDDGVNQWLFNATDAATGRYVGLLDSHDALFEGASGTAGAHKILLGA